jgi:hypothetical protein
MQSLEDPIEKINNIETQLTNAEEDFRNKMIKKT